MVKSTFGKHMSTELNFTSAQLHSLNDVLSGTSLPQIDNSYTLSTPTSSSNLGDRLASLESMVHKLVFKIEEQQQTIATLSMNQNNLYQHIKQNMEEKGEAEEERDKFVVELLGSITNVSSNYLRKMNKRRRSDTEDGQVSRATSGSSLSQMAFYKQDGSGRVSSASSDDEGSEDDEEPVRHAPVRKSKRHHKVNPPNSYQGNKDTDIHYRMLKAPQDVSIIWNEYICGLDGNPPVQYLEEKYGNKWRLNKNVKTFARRKRLYKYIMNGVSGGKSTQEVIDELENRRIYYVGGRQKVRSIGWLQESLLNN